MTESPHYARLAAPVLAEALTDTPVVLIHGPRQSGKTTLARRVGEPQGFAYFTFDDAATLGAARTDPVGFVEGLPKRAILDEVQRLPELFATLKLSVDRNRVPGRFILTGSANVLMLPRLSDSLAGRMAILRLRPLAQAELTGIRHTFLDRLFEGRVEAAPGSRLGTELLERIVAGGFPAALALASPRRRAAWYRDYAETIVQRDVSDMSRIRSLDVLPRLLTLAAGQTARLINVSDLAAPFGLARPTIDSYVTLLERVFLLERLQPWSNNRLSRLIKTAKLHACDTGLACALLGLDSAALAADRTLLGQLVETFVVQELRRLASSEHEPSQFLHYRTKHGSEVDLVLERGARSIVGVEVKASATVRTSDFRGLRELQRATGERFRAGVLLHDGEAVLPFGERLKAVPIRALWE